MSQAAATPKVLMENRQARHEYFIEETLEAGLMLEGWEVKAILAGNATFNAGSAFVRLNGGEAFLDAMTITPRATDTNQGLLHSCNPLRLRKLLLKRQELHKLGKKVREKGYTLVPLAIVQGRKLKLQIAVAKGKNQADKRQTVKDREVKREVQRSMRGAL